MDMTQEGSIGWSTTGAAAVPMSGEFNAKRNHRSITATGNDPMLPKPAAGATLSPHKKIKTEPSADISSPSLRAIQDDNGDDDVVVETSKPAAKVLLVPGASAVTNDNDDDVQVLGAVVTLKLSHLRQHCMEHPYSATKLQQNGSFCAQCYCFVCDIPAHDCTLWRTHCHANENTSFWHNMRDRERKRGLSTSNHAVVSATPANATTTATTTAPSAALATEQEDQDVKPAATADIKEPISMASPEAIAAAQALQVPPGCHPRFACPLHKFTPMNEVGDNMCHANAPACANCMCFVCELPAHACKDWYYGHWKQEQKSHCNADCFGPTHEHWKVRHLEHLLTRHGGALPPDTPWTDVRDADLMKCRYCGWFIKNYNYPLIQYCDACGRLARPQERAYEQSWADATKKYFVPQQHHVELGQREMKFTVVERDPRKLDKYKKRWADLTNKWVYDKVDQMRDALRSHLTLKPRLHEICTHVATVRLDKLQNIDHPEPRHGHRNDVLWFENVDDVCLLMCLDRIAPSFGLMQPENPLMGTLEFEWNDAKCEGIIRLHVFVNPTQTCDPLYMTAFVGLWDDQYRPTFDYMLAHHRPTKVDDDVDLDFWELHEWVEKKKIQISEIRELQSEADKIYKDAQKALAKLKSVIKPSIMSSAGSMQFMGGFCGTDVSLGGITKRFVREAFPELVHEEFRHQSLRNTLLESAAGGRMMPKRGRLSLRHFVGPKQVVQAELLANDCNTYAASMQNVSNVMVHLENLGHDERFHVEGLQVKLLSFQRQTLKWALERETVDGGIQSNWTTALPFASSPLYFNFVTGQFSHATPGLVRGGIIAEEMGLGKTVISLGLILANPAPLVPSSGSSAADIDLNADQSGLSRDTSLFAKCCGLHKKRGSIVSRGTLVICNVSLVGQWIDEAKSKLADPGLVYPYHGSGRRRNARVLAQNSIVVTTYETLASDFSYHSKNKSDGNDYCPPCEQVRWWRVICDECHVLRATATQKTKAVMQLVADNKWLVSGTPIGTSWLDLENQLVFLGIEHTRAMMKLFGNGIARKARGKKRQKSQDADLDWRSCPVGRFTFLLRSVMIRHAQSQRYSRTGTTLMSLPVKTERVIEVSFSGQDKSEYQKMERAAQEFYAAFDGDLRKHYLLLTSKLLPLRIACAGGCVPVDSPKHDDSVDSNGGPPPGNHRTKQTVFSKFAYTSKLQRLITELQKVRDSDPSSKSLVFSQFMSTLDWLKSELPRRGFQFRYFSGDMTMEQRAAALRAFQNDPPTTVFLLSMRAGACGINLTQANRVFILEPCYNPALEAQAIGRVYRLGQTRAVTITRLVMRNSVETRLRALQVQRGYVATSHVKAEATNAGSKTAAGGSTGTAAVQLGSLRTDQAAVAATTAHDFDVLFGVKGKHSGMVAADDLILPDENDDDEHPMPDVPLS